MLTSTIYHGNCFLYGNRRIRHLGAPLLTVMVESDSGEGVNTISGAFIVFAIYFFISGWSAIETADQSEDLARGTIIEDDPFSNQLNENMRDSGYEDIFIGVVLLIIGGVFSLISNQTDTSEVNKDMMLEIQNQIPVKQLEVCELCGANMTLEASIRRCNECRYYLDTTNRKQPLPKSSHKARDSLESTESNIENSRKQTFGSSIVLGEEDKKKLFCPKCETQLKVKVSHFGEIKCPVCKEQFNFQEIKNYWWNE